MPSSSLDPDNFLESDRQLGKGHGLDALGPSDMSDTGSDALGAYSEESSIAGADIGFDRIATTDQLYDPLIDSDLVRKTSGDPEIDAELAADPTMDLDLDSLADVDPEVDGDELLDEGEIADNGIRT